MATSSGSGAAAEGSGPTPSALTTRQALHAVGEWLLAGPQYERAKTIRLKVMSGGITTRDGLVSVAGTEIVSRVDGTERRAPLSGTLAGIGRSVGLTPSIPEGLYSDHAPATPLTEIDMEPVAVAELFDWFARGQAGLLRHVPDEEPILWPEHFDVGVAYNEVNYGISPGDDFHSAPYAYVGPWKLRVGAFWNAPFGAVRAAAELKDEAAVGAFFAEGAASAGRDPLA